MGRDPATDKWQFDEPFPQLREGETEAPGQVEWEAGNHAEERRKGNSISSWYITKNHLKAQKDNNRTLSMSQ
jgi:hypothetical protein